tara:strand:+ start:304 stop:843 length:540 start_codon:yes stop_codon:yes gene_type:complete
MALPAAAAPYFAASLGLNLLGGLSQRRAAQERARQTYLAALRANQSAEESFGRQQSALGARLREEQATAAQSRLAKTIQGLQARGALKATGRAGLTASLLLADQERQAANARESINQTLESFTRQYRRNTQRLVADRDNRRNQLQSQVNQAYNQIPSLSSIILGTATEGLSSFISLADF